MIDSPQTNLFARVKYLHQWSPFCGQTRKCAGVHDFVLSSLLCVVPLEAQAHLRRAIPVACADCVEWIDAVAMLTNASLPRVTYRWILLKLSFGFQFGEWVWFSLGPGSFLDLFLARPRTDKCFELGKPLHGFLCFSKLSRQQPNKEVSNLEIRDCLRIEKLACTNTATTTARARFVFSSCCLAYFCGLIGGLCISFFI